MNNKTIKNDLYEITYLIKQIISNVSLERYEDSMYDLLNVIDYINLISEEISKENFSN